MLEAVRDILAWVFRPLIERHRGNLRLVVGCLFLSSLIWLFNSLNKEIETKISITLKVKYNDRDFFPLASIPKNVEAVVSGYGWHLLRFSVFQKPSQVYIWIKYPNMHSRLDTTLIRHYIESNLDNVVVKHVLIDSSYLSFDRKTHKRIHIKVDVPSISLANGYTHDSIISIQPESILVTGPNTNLIQIPDTLKVTIPFKNLDKDFNESIRLSYFLHNSNLKSSHEKVIVKFKVKKKAVSHAE